MKALRAIARFSENGVDYADDGRYRVNLDILLRADAPTERIVTVLMMNPSTARAENGLLVPDPTVAKMCGYARRLDCDRIIVVNAFGVRLTDSRKLHKTPMPSGNPLNDKCIVQACAVSDVLLVAWGRLHPSLLWRERELRTLLRNTSRPPTYALALNKDACLSG